MSLQVLEFTVDKKIGLWHRREKFLYCNFKMGIYLEDTNRCLRTYWMIYGCQLAVLDDIIRNNPGDGVMAQIKNTFYTFVHILHSSYF